MTSSAPVVPRSTEHDGPNYPSEIRHGYQNRAILSNLSTSIMGFIVAGQLMQMFATEVLHFNAVQIGWILSLLPLGQFIRLGLLYFPHRFTRNQVVTFTCIIRLLTLGCLLIVPVARLTFALFLGLILLFNYFQIIADVYWQPILREITTVDDRGSFFARIRFWWSLVGSITIGLFTLFVGKQITHGQYQLAIALALAGTANTLYWCWRLPNFHGKTAAYGWRHLYHVALRSPLLRRPLLVSLLLSFAVIPAFTVYQIQLLHIPANIIAALVCTASIGHMLSFMFWGLIADRIGYRPLMNGTLLLLILFTPLYLFVAPFPTTHFAWTALPIQAFITIAVLLLINFFDGVLNAGNGIGSIILMHHHVHHHESVEAINLFTMASSFAVSLAALWSGYLLKNIAFPIGDIPFLRGVLHLDAVKIYLLFGILLFRLMAMVIISKLPNSRPNQPLSSFFTSLFALATSPFRRRP